MYNLIVYSDNYLKTSGDLWQYYRDDPNDNIIQSESFKFKINKTGKAPEADNKVDVKIYKIVLLAKSKLNSIKVLTSKVLIDSVISHDEFVLIKNVLKEYDEMKKGIKNLKT